MWGNMSDDSFASAGHRSLAVPVLSPDGATVLGTLGIGMHAPHEFSDDEKARLSAIARKVGETWSAI